MLALTSIVSSLNFSRNASRAEFKKSLNNLMVRNCEITTAQVEVRPVVKAGSTRFSDFGSFEQFRSESQEGFNTRRGKSSKAPRIGVDLQYMWGTSDTFR